MKFKGLRRFSGKDEFSVIKYLGVELAVAMKDLFEGLTRLKLTENFESFTITELIPATTEIQIPNRLKTTDLKKLIVRQFGSGFVSDGTTEWTSEFVYLRNHGTGDVTVTVIFMR